MMHELPPYPEYKDSDAPWLGKIPAHWECRKTKFLFDERVEKGFPEKQLLAATQTRGVIPKSAYEIRTVTAQKDLHLLKLVEPSDFVISLRSFQGGIERSYAQGIISPAYTIMIPGGEVNCDYFKHLAKAKVFLGLLKTCVTGIREGQNIDYNKLRNALLPLPAYVEQTQIARFLDWKTTQINKFIHNKRDLIALLKEQKQNIINQAVTRGLNPDVKLKPSGVEWIGNIPEHWEIRRIKTVTKIVRGKFSHRPRNDPSLYDGKFPFIQTGDVARAKKYIVEYKQTLNQKGFAVSKEFPKGTLTMTIAANIGDVAILDFDACFPDSIVGFIPTKCASLEFLFYLFTAMKKEFLKEAPVNTQGNLNIERIGSMFITMPEFAVQQAIVRSIETRSSAIDQVITRAEREIELMREYRARLISDVVTGKVDVRAVDVPELAVGELLPVDEDVEEDENSEETLEAEE